MFNSYISAFQLCLKEETSGGSCVEQLHTVPGGGGGISDMEGGSSCSSDDTRGRGTPSEAGE